MYNIVTLRARGVDNNYCKSTGGSIRKRMLEIEIKSTETLNEQGIDFWDHLKARSQVFANRLTAFDPKLAQRVERCAESVKFKECTNGYLVFKSARLCRVRGCPLCEWRRSRRVARQVAVAVGNCQIKPTEHWHLLTLSSSVEPIPLARIEDTLNILRDGFSRLAGLKDWRLRGGFSFIQFHWLDNGVEISIKFLGLCKPLNGKNYVSKSRWTQLWKQSLRQVSVPTVEVEKFGSIPFNYVAQRCKILAWRQLDLEVCPDSYFQEVFEQIHKRKMLTGMGCFKSTFTKVREPRRPYYPSEKNAIWAMKTKHFGYLPNPREEEHKEQFLELPEYYWDEKLLEEFRWNKDLSQRTGISNIEETE